MSCGSSTPRRTTSRTCSANSRACSREIPVVALSANAIPRDIERGLEAGFFRYLTKPIKVNEFMDTLDVALKFAQQDAIPGG